MSLELGGAVRGLKFNIGTLKYLGELTGVDPFQFKAEGNNFSDLLPYAIKITHAALLSNCLSKKQDPDFTDADVQSWVDDLSISELTEIVNHYNAIFASPKASANGEVSADTQSANV